VCFVGLVADVADGAEDRDIRCEAQMDSAHALARVALVYREAALRRGSEELGGRIAQFAIDWAKYAEEA
jgi:hypothetical protein